MPIFAPNSILTPNQGEYYPPAFLYHVDHAVKLGSGGLLLLWITNYPLLLRTHGREGVEQVMARLSAEIEEILPSQGTAWRIQRDQLALVVPGCDADGLQEIILQIAQSFPPMESGEVGYPYHCEMGMVHFDGARVADAQDAMDKAYISLYQPREGVESDASAGRQDAGLAQYLRSAVQENRLRLAYQAVIESKTGRLAHYEALLRLLGRQGKLNSAGALIPVAERMGLIHLVDGMVMEKVIEELRRAPELSLALNISNLTTEDASWLKRLTELCEATPGLGARLIVEITETAAQRDLRQAAYFVASVQALGAQVALDDFGSGYTSFRQLKALSVDMVKIDGAFVRDLASNADNQFFVKTLLDFAKGFGLTTVAEFVENGETAKLLMEWGVDYLQGYYFGKPQTHRSWLKDGEYSSE